MKQFFNWVGPVQSFQWAFASALLTVAWTEAVLYFKHRTKLTVASAGGGHQEDIRSDISVAIRIGSHSLLAEAKIQEYRQAVETALLESLYSARKCHVHSVTCVSVVESNTFDSALASADDLARQALNVPSQSHLNIGVGLIEHISENIKQVYVVTVTGATSGSVLKRTCAISMGIPSQFFTNEDMTNAVRRSLAQLATE
jgi:hypothetical protein